MIKTVKINTFIYKANKGSLQFLHFYPSKQVQKKAFDDFNLKDEYDHSFVYMEDLNKTYVLWKNKAGQIQFCGSAAYALSYYILSDAKTNTIEIQSEYLNLKSSYNKNVLLHMKEKSLKENIKFKNSIIYYNKKDGIYFVDVKDKKLLQDGNFLKIHREFLEEEFKNNIHGLCFFLWQNDKGYLRYFTPWHGRDEDYVTGSIHQYLTPLVARLYGSNKQQWRQMSSSGGMLFSSYDEGLVNIWGDCQVAN